MASFDVRAWAHTFPNIRRLCIYETIITTISDAELTHQKNESIRSWTKLEEVHSSVGSVYQLALSAQVNRFRLNSFAVSEIPHNQASRMLLTVLRTAKPRILHLWGNCYSLRYILKPGSDRSSKLGWMGLEELTLEVAYWKPSQDEIIASVVRYYFPEKAILCRKATYAFNYRTI